ncbi:YetF domain-containing protein [Sporosarcina cascadiensis]|uniref:YetF domain-containing protein n=1 Tax=Sporosarcina cascadiensis TaxID=2660747 RepID=UPI001E38CDBD|nr:YetF domain-containing protein [Sporosarcina cascadiensis]
MIALVLVLTLLVFEYLSMKVNIFERLTRGTSKVVIENDTLKLQNKKKLRLTVDELEMHLRPKSIEEIDNVKWATIEMSGHLGYSLIDRIQLTLQEMSKQLELHVTFKKELQPLLAATNLFSEIEEGHSPPVPERLK